MATGYFEMGNIVVGGYGTGDRLSFTVNKVGNVSGAYYNVNLKIQKNQNVVGEWFNVAKNQTGSNFAITLTNDLIGPYMPDFTKGMLAVEVETKGSSTEYSSIKKSSIEICGDVRPSISGLSIERQNVFEDCSISKVTNHRLKFKVKGLYGAYQTVVVNTGGYDTTIHVPAVDDDTLTEVDTELGVFDSGEADGKNIQLKIAITDQRGRTYNTSKIIKIYKYSPPEITVATVMRNESEQPTLTFAGKYQSSVAGAANTLKGFFARCTVNGTNYDTDLIGKTSPQVLTGTYDISKTYTFEVHIQDSVNPNEIIQRVILPSEKLAMDIGADGKTVTFFGTTTSSSDKEALRIGDFANFAADKSELTKEFYLNNQFILRSQNGIFGYKPSTGEKVLAFEPQSGAGNTTIGWGNYNLGKGSTNIYSGENMALVGKKDILFTAGGVYRGRYSGATRVLATPIAFMNANQTANLSEKVSEQLFGIVLCFSLYYNNAVSGQFTFHFVPKTVVAQESRFYAFPMTTSKYWYMGTRYLKITDTQIIGSNENTGDNISTSGGTVNQSKFILYKVYGV